MSAGEICWIQPNSLHGHFLSFLLKSKTSSPLSPIEIVIVPQSISFVYGYEGTGGGAFGFSSAGVSVSFGLSSVVPPPLGADVGLGVGLGAGVGLLVVLPPPLDFGVGVAVGCLAR